MMIVMVLGMHRSGTSAMAGLLHKNGVAMGREKDFYPPPIKENPKGFYENVRFRRINDAILKEYGYRVKSFLPQVPDVHPQGTALSERVENLILEYDREFPIWGWKDPRTSLTAPVWFSALKRLGLIDSTRVILMEREHCKVAESMRRRGNKERYDDQFEQLSIKYYNRIRYYLYYLGFKLEVLALNFEGDVLVETEVTCTLLSLFLGHQIRDMSHIEPSISKGGKFARAN